MSRKMDKSNMKSARADYKAEQNWENMLEEKNEIYEMFSNKTCTFCKKPGHCVFYKGEIRCLKLLENKCLSCNKYGHTPKYCKFLSKIEN